MPQYYADTYFKKVKVTTRPSSLMRRFFRFSQYYVGQKVSFHLKVEKLVGVEVNLHRFAIMELIPGKEYPHTITRLPDDQSFSGHIKGANPIGREGNVEYRLCDNEDFDTGKLLFTAKATSPDSKNATIGLSITSAIIGAIISRIPEIIKFFVSLFKAP
jgi:hypothetical protein